jgi:dihydrofolate synthase/folylpolyglutamate synthase
LKKWSKFGKKQKNNKVNFEETIEYMFSKLPMYQRVGKAAYKADMETSYNFDKYLDKPHKHYKTIHVAGTNGKGSVSHTLASVLQVSGLKVGLYTSPHLKCFTERIRVNGEEIEKQFVSNFVQIHKAFIETEKPSFFEITVFMAFEYFKHKNVDVAVIETGMGGRLDSTNVINPLLSIVTNISLDHTSFLGNTLAEIAAEKAGIIKQKTDVVIGETNTETKKIFMAKAIEKQAGIYFADQYYKIDYSTLSPDFKQIFNVKDKNGNIVFENLECDLPGIYQRKNIVTTLLSIKILQKYFHISNKNIYSGIANIKLNTSFLGRWQILSVNPLTVCDTGHNEAGLSEVVKQIEMTAYKKLYFVLGTVNDKNIDKILKLLPQNAYYFFTQAQIPRAMDSHKLAMKAKQTGLHGEIISNVKKAYYAAKQKAEKNDMIFIGGSTFVVAEVL